MKEVDFTRFIYDIHLTIIAPIFVVSTELSTSAHSYAKDERTRNERETGRDLYSLV